MLVRGSTLNLSRIGVHIGPGPHWTGSTLDPVHIGPGPHWGKAELKNVSELNWLEKAHSCYSAKKTYISIDNTVFFLV